MATDPNIDTLREMLAASDRGDTDSALRLVHPDVKFEPLRAAIQGAYRGHAGVGAFWADTAESFDAFHLDYPDVRSIDRDRVLAVGTIHVRGKGSGAETDIPSALIVTFDSGLVVHLKDFGDRTAALAAARLPE